MAETLSFEEFEQGLTPARSRQPPVPRRRPDRLSFEEFERGVLEADGPEVLSFEVHGGHTGCRHGKPHH